MAIENSRTRKKVCNFCADNVTNIDFTDAPRMRRYLTERGKILPRRITGTCAKHQRLLATRIKTSRHAGLIPFIIAG